MMGSWAEGLSTQPLEEWETKVNHMGSQLYPDGHPPKKTLHLDEFGQCLPGRQYSVHIVTYC